MIQTPKEGIPNFRKLPYNGRKEVSTLMERLFTACSGPFGARRGRALPGPPKGPLVESLWPLLVGTWSIVEGS